MNKMPDYRMKWIRIWPHAWFDSSMRVELTNEERAFWVDMLARAGKSRIPGVICSDPEGKVGYPLAMLTSQLVSWTQDQVVNILDKLEKTDRVQVTRSPLFSGEEGWIVHITNWEKYQSEAQRVQKYRNTARSERRNQPISTTSSCTTGRIEEEVEEEVDKKENKKVHAPNGASAAFETFWKSYPRKTAKQPAEKAFKKLDPNAKLLTEIISSVEVWAKTEQWQEQDGKFIPHASTFLNQRRWEDEPPKARSTDRDTSHLEKL